MARSTTHSNQRPDTLMQDRICQVDETLLQRTAGPYIRVNRVLVGTSGVGANQPFVGIDKGRGPARVVVRSYQCFASRPSELWVVPNWGRLAQKIISPTTGSSARNPSHDEQRALVSRGMRIGEYFRSIWSRIRRCVSRLKLMALALCSWSSFSWIPKRFERGIPSRYKVTVGHDRARDLTGKRQGKI
jgi:hypothetical protein